MYYQELPIEHHKASTLMKAGWYINGFWRCKTLQAAKDAIDTGVHKASVDQFAQAAYRVMSSREQTIENK